MRILLEVQRLNLQQDIKTTLRVKRLKKIDDFLWLPKLIEMIDHTDGARTTLTIEEVSYDTPSSEG